MRTADCVNHSSCQPSVLSPAEQAQDSIDIVFHGILSEAERRHQSGERGA